MDNTHLLRQVTIFQALPQDTIADLAKRVWHKQADAGSVIVSQEEAGDALFVIAKGKRLFLDLCAGRTDLSAAQWLGHARAAQHDRLRR